MFKPLNQCSDKNIKALIAIAAGNKIIAK